MVNGQRVGVVSLEAIPPRKVAGKGSQKGKKRPPIRLPDGGVQNIHMYVRSVPKTETNIHKPGDCLRWGNE